MSTANWTAEKKRLYNGLLKMQLDSKSELYKPDGTPRGGANVRCAFWDGYNGRRHLSAASGTLLEVAWMAGRDAAARTTQEVGRKPRVYIEVEYDTAESLLLAMDDLKNKASELGFIRLFAIADVPAITQQVLIGEG